MDLHSLDRSALIARRAALAHTLGGKPALIAAGAPSPRQYAANTWPFRATSHFLYLTGVHLPSAFLLLEGKEATLFVPPRPEDDELWHGPLPSNGALGEALGCPVRTTDELESRLPKGTAALPAVDMQTAHEQSRLLGRAIRYGALASDRDVELADAMIALRLVHDEAAQRGLREAAQSACEAHLLGMAISRLGLREHDVRGAMQGRFLARGHSVSYEPIVTVHGEVLHSHGYDNELSAGDLLLADVGSETAGGWASDVTRVWPVSGSFSSTQRILYDLVLEANRKAIEACVVGTRYRDIHLLAARVMTAGLVDLDILRGDVDELVADGVHALFFPHGVGHLIGLDVHDMEDLGDRAGYAPGRARSTQFGLSYLRLDRDLLPGMAVTIEPGLYIVPAILRDHAFRARVGDRLNEQALARFSDVRGIRIEDDVLVTSGEPEVLSAAIPKSAEEIEARVGSAS